MPLFEFKCYQCGAKTEHLMRYEESETAEVLCVPCSLVMVKQIPMIAKTTGLWNSGWQAGLSNHGTYDHGLGMKIYSEHHRDAVLKSKGLERVSDLGGEHFIDDKIEQFDSERTEQLKFDSKFQDAIKRYDGDMEKVYDEVMPAKAILNGELDHLT